MAIWRSVRCSRSLISVATSRAPLTSILERADVHAFEHLAR